MNVIFSGLIAAGQCNAILRFHLPVLDLSQYRLELNVSRCRKLSKHVFLFYTFTHICTRHPYFQPPFPNTVLICSNGRGKGKNQTAHLTSGGCALADPGASNPGTLVTYKNTWLILRYNVTGGPSNLLHEM